MARRRTWIGTGLAAAVAITAGMALFLAGRALHSRGPVDDIRIATAPAYYSLLFLVAAEKGYFGSNGLKVTLDTPPVEYTAIEKLMAGQADFAVASEYSFAAASLTPGAGNLRIVASTAAAMAQELVARRDHGIQSPPDLEGKKICVLKDSPTEFSLDRFLILQNIPPEKVTKVSLPYDECADAVAKGDADAAVLFDAALFKARQALGANAVIWPTNVTQPHYWLLISTAEVIEAKPLAVRRLLKALTQAQTFTATHREQADGLATSSWSYSKDFVAQVRQTSEFRISLDQALIPAMEDEARWLMTRQPSAQQTMPNYFRLIHMDALVAVRPEAISIYR